MSSSIFIENTPVTRRSSGSLDEKYALGKGIKSPTHASDSNLVVVYGKNGMSFDRKGLENLIEEKTLSSISVIRLTSPTPSMEEEEADIEKLSEGKRKQEDHASDEENFEDSEALSTNDERNSNDSEADQVSDLNGSEASSSDNEFSASEMEDKETSTRQQKRKYTRKNKKVHKKSEESTRGKSKKERPEIVGLTVEEFYPPEDAKQMAKEILKLAGVSTIRRSADCEFQLYVIKNDHCYTPFTSPAQMKAKLEAEKLDAEKLKSVGRKLLPQNYASVKQLITKKKLQQADVPKSSVVIKKAPIERDTVESKIHIEGIITNQKPRKIDYEDSEHTDDENNGASSVSDDEEEFGESDFSTSELSVESENDRESDLDFDVNNRKGRKRKVQNNNKIIKRGLSSKSVLHKRHQSVNQENISEINKTVPGMSSLQRSNTDNSRVPNRNISTSGKTIVSSSSARKVMPSPSNTVLSSSKKSLIVESTSPSSQQTTLGSAVRRGPIVQVGTPPRNPQLGSSNGKVSASPQPVKEIVINKVIASPKGGFTDIGALLSQSENQMSAPTTPTSSTRPLLLQKTTPSSKGFMPLGIETAAKNQLPSQISIQTHQSSSELAAEHDKQLDLIDSIVKDEMEKSSIIEKAPGENENIPQLVKMLESTERALKSKKSDKINEFSSSRTIDHDIDISNAPLLENPGDEIPDDLLQHVVELIEDDKTLQEAVEKQVFGEDSNVTVEPVSMPVTQMRPLFETPPENTKSAIRPPEKATPVVMRSQPIPEPQTRSIIQATLFNDFTASVSVQDTSQPPPPSILSKNVSSVRKEPIQIVRGNGRVITLPPIEAPTTRAKRRAQTQPKQNESFSVPEYSPNASMNDSFDTSMQSLQSFSMDSSAAVVANSSILEKKTSETPSNSRRRVSKEGSASTKATRKGSTKKATAATSKMALKHETADDASNSHGDDDDPKKLWCVCRQPHNNRFMICCDVCEDWFHGTCVSITKAMGLEMEQKGIDWTCPKCVKKAEDKKQRKITDMMGIRKANTTQPSPSGTNSMQRQNTQNNSDASAPVIPIALTEGNKFENVQKKQVIEIKKIQSGQFISLKNLEEQKLPLTVLTSGQKKQFLPLNSTASHPTPKSIPGMQTQARRVIVVQKMSAPKIENPKKAITPDKLPQQQQHIRSQKMSISTPTNFDSTTTGSNSLAASPPPAVVVQPIQPTTPCIVCKKPSRPNSIYCSDDCIRKHAQNALNAFTAKTSENTSSASSYTKFGTEDKKKKAKSLFEDLLSMADRKPKVERVNVFERKSGRFLTGNNAPTTANLKKWLQDNPTFEVVQPGSSQAIEIERRQKQRSAIFQKQLSDTNSIYSTSTTANIQTTDGQTKESFGIQPKAIKQIIEQTKLSPLVRPQTPKQLVKHSQQQVSLKSDKPQKLDSKDETKSKEKTLKRQSSENNYKKSASSASGSGTEASTITSDSEPIRINVRRTLRDQLLLRINELAPTNDGNGNNEMDSNNKPSVEYVEQFVKETELEMHNYFNRDTGAKYKAKYRSLMFNIKDRKNQTLFQKICAKVIKPSQLVRMSPEELASQELAQWRENEAKHQLEMIKKSELDLLSCAKNYVLKTHKGEEVIEGKSTDCVNLDMTIPVEDVVSVLNNSTSPCGGGGGGGAISRIDPTITRRDYFTSEANILVAKETYESQRIENYEAKSVDDKNKMAEERHRLISKEREYEKEKIHKNKERHREKSKTRRRSRSRSRSREKRHKSSSHKDDKREKEERERDRDRERDHGREREQRARPKDDQDKRFSEKKSSAFLPSTPANSPLTIKSSNPGSAKDKHKESHITSTQSRRGDTPASSKHLESFSLIDHILESTKTVEEAANIVSEKNKVEHSTPIQQNVNPANITTSLVAPEISSSSVYSISQNSTDSDQEPTSTVSIISSPQDPYASYFNTDAPLSIWSGNINMIDVASFQILIQSVVGNAVNLGKLLPEELDVVGRIGPETVWDYISKIKKSPNKEVVILRLLPACDSETMAYTILYKYLHKRNRLGVIKTNSSQIKDFYIFPLGAGNQMPSVLQSTESVDFYEDPYRPDILVAIVIRVIGKRFSTIGTVQQQSSVKVQKFHAKLKNSDSYTPPGSPKKRRVVSSVQKNDDIDIDAIIKAPIVAKKVMAPVVSTSTTVDDQDEPYSPGCSSDEDLPLLNAKSTEYNKTAEEELKRKMDELNRQIAAQEMEIAGLLNVEPSKFLPSPGACATTKVLKPTLASISIPSNLSQILASIKHKPEAEPSKAIDAPQPAAAPPPPLIGSLLRSQRKDADDFNPGVVLDASSFEDGVRKQETPSKSRLAQLSEAELLSMVPDDMLDPTTSSLPPPPAKKPRYDEPPPPGV